MDNIEVNQYVIVPSAFSPIAFLKGDPCPSIPQLLIRGKDKLCSYEKVFQSNCLSSSGILLKKFAILFLRSFLDEMESCSSFVPS